MQRLHELCRGHPRLRSLIEFALSEGWQVAHTAGGHLKFTKPGLPPIYTAAIPSEYRADRNRHAQLKRVERLNAPNRSKAAGGKRHERVSS